MAGRKAVAVVLNLFMALLPFVESSPRAYRRKASNAPFFNICRDIPLLARSCMCALRYAGCEDGIWRSCMNLLISLLATILGVYAVLLAVYFAPAVLLFGQVGGLVYLRFKKKKNHARRSNEILDKA